MNPYVKSVKPQENYCLLLTFENGEKRIFDLKPYFDKPIFAKLKNESKKSQIGAMAKKSGADKKPAPLFYSLIPLT